MRYYISGQDEPNRECYDLDVLGNLHEKEYTVLDFEADGLDPYTLKPILLGLYYEGDEYIINLLTFSKEQIKEVFDNIQPEIWIIHNAKYDYELFLCQYNVKLKKIWCTQLCSQVLYNGTDLGHGLDDCLIRHFNVYLNKSTRNTFINRDLSLPITDEEIEYLAGDLKHLRLLQQRQYQRGIEQHLLETFALENAYIPVIAHMELAGIKVNEVKLRAFVRGLEIELINKDAEVRKEIARLSRLYPNLLKERTKKSTKQQAATNQLGLFNTGDYVDQKKLIKEININSPVQIKVILSRCKVFIESTKEEFLEKFKLENPKSDVNLFIEKLLDYRGTKKLISTYGEKFFRWVNPITGRIHTNYSQCFTQTGRLSSSSPNLQNIPKNKLLRNAFEADDMEKYTLVDVDMSGQELRLAASYSQDKLILANFNEGLDLHGVLATKTMYLMTGDDTIIVSKEVNSDFREKHKRVLFGFIYGAGAQRIADVLNIPLETAKEVHTTLKQTLKGLDIFIETHKRLAVNKKVVRDCSKINRLRYFNTHTLREAPSYEVEKEGCNFPIQSTGASMMKEAGIAILKYIEDNNLDCQIKMQVHDEYIVQIPTNRLDIANEIQRIMEEVGTTYLEGVKMKSDMLVFPYWNK